ncbi:MAG: tyrosine-type recombinase/integrase, partial [Chloroflexota bacterium]
VRTIQRRIRSLGTQAGLPVSLSPHMLRRSFATHLLNKGADLFTIASLMGHENIEVTRLYALTSPKKREEALLLLP